MMNYLRFTLIIALIAIGLDASAQATFALLQPRTAIEGQKFTITFRLTNGQANAPQAPQLENCKFVYGPSTSTMSSTQIINGQMSSSTSIDYTFTYLAEKAGTITIPAVSISAGGKTLSSNPTQYTILPPDQSAQSQGSGSPSAMPGGAAPSKGTSQISADDMFVRISLNKSSVYEQEAVVATVKVYTRYEISSFQITSQPTFEGFLSEELDIPSGVEMEHYNGKNYYTAYLKKCIIYPQKAGTLTITSGKYDVTLVDYELVSNGFFQTRRPVEKHVVTQSNSAKLNVTALPEPRPASFNGAVGDFSASVEMKPTELRTNEAASYIIKVEGTGNIKYLKTPTLDLPPGIDQFTPKTDINARFTGSDMRGTYSVNYTLVPQDPGAFEIPERQFSYFNPKDKKYHTIDLRGFDIKVAQGAATMAVTEQKTIAKGMTDILHIKAATGSQLVRPSYDFRAWWYWMLYLIAAVALIVVIFIYRRQLRLQADVRGRKLARANKVAAKKFKAARAAMAAGEADKFYAELNRATWGYLSDKLGIPASQLLRSNIASQLSAYGVGEEAVSGILDILDQCEMARFTPQHSEAEMSELYRKAEGAVKAIENTKGAKPQRNNQ